MTDKIVEACAQAMNEEKVVIDFRNPISGALEHSAVVEGRWNRRYHKTHLAITVYDADNNVVKVATDLLRSVAVSILRGYENVQALRS